MAASGRAGRGDRARPVGEEAGHDEHEEHLAELRRLEGEEADVDPPMRAARRRARREHEHHQPERAEVDRPAKPPVGVGVDEEHDDEEQRAGRGVEALPRGGRAADVVPRDPVDRREPVADDARRARTSAPSRAGAARRRAPSASASRRLRSPRALVSTASIAHQSERVLGRGAVFLKYFSKTLRAAGAAAVPPWPPFSITAQTTIVGVSYGP